MTHLRHNNPVPISKFKKDWQNRVKNNFDVPAKRRKRKALRLRKATLVFPRPIELLRPLVRPPSIRNKHRLRFGKGFSAEELKGSGIPIPMARTIGIAFDRRRQNRCEESLNLNIQRLKEYKSKLILFPIHAKKPNLKSPIPEATPEQIKNVMQYKGNIFPEKKIEKKIEFVEITPELKKLSAVQGVKKARRSIRRIGYLVKKKLKEEEQQQKSKKKEGGGEGEEGGEKKEEKKKIEEEKEE